MHLHMILDLTHQVLLMSQEKQWNVRVKIQKYHILNKAAEKMEIESTDNLNLMERKSQIQKVEKKFL